MPHTATKRPTGKDVATMPTVLVVDDDAALTRMLRLTLRDGGFDVTTAANGALALDQIDAEHLPDAIVLDLEMPVMDGRSFYRELRERGFEVPVLVLSAYGARVAQRELGANAYLNKPFDPEDLITEVRELVA